MKNWPNSGNLSGFPVSAEQGVANSLTAQPDMAGVLL
jgi:hypothetical protein